MDNFTSTENTQQPEIVLDNKQLEAVQLCVDTTHRLVAVTGAAGSGKTTILKRAYKELTDAGYKVALCSPTGKAAKRIQEVTGIEAYTIHRLLEYSHPGDPDPKTGKPVGTSVPRRDRTSPLSYDVVFADEYAMVNREVNNALLAAIPGGGSIRMFGDSHQLAPIEDDKTLQVTDTRGRGYGAPRAQSKSAFLDILNNPKLPSVTLDTVYRQGADSGLLMNLHEVLKGKMPTRNDQWDMKFTEQPIRTLETAMMEALDDGIDFSKPENQVITLQNKSWTGTLNLNKCLQRLFNPNPPKSARVPRNNWVTGDDGEKGSYTMMGVGDKVIMTRNNYDLALLNGETGTIIDITGDDEVIIDFGDKEQSVPPVLMVLNRYGKLVEIDPRKDIDLAYALTTHKTQGSEYSRVVYIMNKSMSFMLSRRNMYTACSRGRDHVLIITDQRSLSRSLANKE